MLIIPAIDLVGARCVRLAQGDYARETHYSEDPVSVAKGFEDAGAIWLHVVDLEGAKAGQPNPQNLKVVEKIAASTNLHVEFGGGVKTMESVNSVLNAGVSRFVLGSALVKDPGFAQKCFETWGERVVAGIDAKDGLVALQGWLEKSATNAVEMARNAQDMGAQRIIFTDISTDGMLCGPNVEQLSQVQKAVDIPVISSGGISSMEDLGLLAQIPTPPEAVIVGKAIYEGRVDLRRAIEAFCLG